MALNDSNNAFSFTGATASVGPFVVQGGGYIAIATADVWPTGSEITLAIIAASGAVVPIRAASFVANGVSPRIDLPACSLMVIVTAGIQNASFSLAPIP